VEEDGRMVVAEVLDKARSGALEIGGSSMRDE
jgi:hypothetical protein